MRLALELRRSNIRYPDLNRSQPLRAKTAAVLPHTLPDTGVFIRCNHGIMLHVTQMASQPVLGQPHRVPDRGGRRTPDSAPIGHDVLGHLAWATSTGTSVVCPRSPRPRVLERLAPPPRDLNRPALVIVRTLVSSA